MHIYDLWLWGVALIVVTTKWIHDAVPPLDATQTKWLSEHGVYIRMEGQACEQV